MTLLIFAAVILIEAPPQTWFLEEVATVDAEWSLLDAAHVGTDGSVWTVDAVRGQVQGWTVDGKPMVVFGRRGGGPGEFSEALQAAIPTDDGLLVADYGRGLVHAGRDGSYKSVEPLRLPLGSFSIRWGTLDGAIIAESKNLRGPPTSLVRIGGQAIVEWPELPALSVALWDAFGARLITARSDEYRIEVRDAFGTVLRSFARDVEPKRLDRAIRESLEAGLAALPEALRPEIPTHEAVLTSVLWLDEGTILVSSRTEEAPTEAVSAADGSTVATVEVPEGVMLLDINGDVAAGVRLDDYFVPELVIMKLIR